MGYVPGTAQFNAVAIANPVISGSTLTFIGPFTTTADTPRNLTYQLSYPAGMAPGARLNSVVGNLGSTIIDTMVSTADNVPATSTVTVLGPPDLSITKSDGGASTTPGSTVAYTISYTHTGNIGATGVVLTEPVPSNSAFNAGASTTGSVCVANTCTLTIGNLAGGGGTASVNFAVTA